MLKYNLVLIFFAFIYDTNISIALITREKFYRKHVVLRSVDESTGASKNIMPTTMEGGTPIRMNSLNVIVKKESKTVPKKGVLNKTDEIDDQSSTLGLDSTLEKTEGKNLSTFILESSKTIITSTLKISSSTENTSTVYIAPFREVLDEQNVVKNVMIQKTVKKAKPKPEVTIGGKEADEPIPASPTVKSHLAIPRKIDYIVPAVITITALPLLGVAFYVVYKRGRDYWDKRHYRKVNFLIDGMYNE